jgi:hypothetical protein
MKKKYDKKFTQKVISSNFPIKKGIFTLLTLFTFYSGIRAQISSGFELDGNATSVIPNPPDDWDKIYNGTSSAQVTTNVVTDADNIFQGGGSKDHLDINNWGWTSGSVPDKDDILHGGVAMYDNCKLYFFADRYATNGSANIGFWLFKSNISTNIDGTFSGIHSVGDLLLVSEFINGGGTAVIKAYKWVGTGGNTNGTLDSIPVNGINSYAITNTAAISSPWPYIPKTGPANQFGPGAFFEGGIDLCNIAGLDPCFTSFLIETRASFEVSAVLKDFMNGTFTSSPQIVLTGGTRCTNGPAVTLTPAVSGGIMPYTYLWSPGGSTDASIMVSPSTQTTYTLAVTGLNGCVKTSTALVSVSTTPNVNAGTDKILNCTTPSVTLTGSSITEGVVFSWTTIGGNIVSGGSSATPLVNAAGTYILTVTSVQECSAIDTVMVTFDGTTPNVNAGIDKTLTCIVNSISLNGSSTTSGALFSWTTIGGNIVSGNTIATPTVNAAGTYILTVTNPLNGCTARDTTMVFINNTQPSVNAGSDSTITCTTSSIVLNGSSSTDGALFSWITLGGNILSGESTTTPTVNAAGTYILTVTHPSNGCTAKDTALININTTTPDVNAGADMVINCLYPTATLNGSSQTPGVLYSWSAITGSITSGENTATPVVSATGSYVLTVTNPINGCTAKDTVNVSTDISTPDVNAGPDKTLTCTSTQVMLNGSSTTEGVTFSWIAINGGVILSGANTATPIVQIPGTYILSVTNPVNGCTASDSADVFQNVNAPNANAGIDLKLTCTTTSILLSGSSSTSGTTYLWTTIDGNIVSGATTLTPLVNLAGDYTLTVTDTSNGCLSSDMVTVRLNDTLPNVNAGIDGTLTCTTTSLNLSSSSTTAGAMFAWTTIGGNIVSGNTTVNPLINATGTYVLTVTDPANGCTSTDTAMIQMDNTLPNVNAGTDAVLNCIIHSVMLTGSSSTVGAVFNWTTIGGNILLGAGTSTPTVNAAGTYILSVTNPANGCIAKDTVMVNLDATIPNVNAGIDSLINCINTSIALHGSSTTADITFNWTTNNGNIITGENTATPTINAAGQYVLHISDVANGCMAMDSVNIILDADAPNVNAGPDTTLTCAVTQVTLSGSSTTPGAVFVWIATNGGVIYSGANTATPIVKIPGTYILAVTNPENGCTAMDSANVYYDNTMPHADAGGDMTLNCSVLTTSLNGFSSTTGATATWTAELGGNIVSDGNTYNPTVNMAGMYILTVTHPTTGCTANDTAIVTIDVSTPDVNAGIDTVIGCGFATLTLNGSSSYNVGYNWTTIGGNIISGASTPTPVINMSGIYILTVIDHINGCSATDTVVIDLSIPPVVDLGNDTSAIFCQGFITLDAGNEGMTYLWNTGATTQTINVMLSGTYYVTVMNSYGCPSSDTINVMITPGTLVIEIGNDTTFMNCHNPTITLDAGVNNATYLWSTSETTQTILVSTSGVYYVTATDSIGCMASDTIQVTVIDNNVDVDLGNDTTVCSCIQLNAGPANLTYMWCSGQDYSTINVCQTGTYCVTVSNGTCIDTDTIHITVNPPPVVNLGPDTLLVSGSLMLNAGNAGATYMWNTGATTQTIVVTESGQYYVTITDIYGCTASDTINVNSMVGITENNMDNFEVTIYPNPSNNKTFSLSFSNSDKSNIEIKILNVLGKVVYSEKLDDYSGAYKKTITLKEATTGIYFADIIKGTQRNTVKIIIE